MKVDFNKDPDGLIPAIIQDIDTKNVLMQGYMNSEALEKTKQTGQVTFFSRSKNRLWTKGEESGNFLVLHDILVDCDQDSLLISARPSGPVCHKGSDTCWNQENISSYGFLTKLEAVIDDRMNNADKESSYVASLFKSGINKIAQKVGEEAVETVIEAKDQDDERFLNESADLLFHFLILLKAKGKSLDAVAQILERRHKP
ncbi:MAG: bifunctional phosphoribosyl-AMP cyclohydrolase/phosphoribosyl-ATP diphosphatase HisIE [Flavobacteriaceae bacterium]